MAPSRRDEALRLAEDILSDIELSGLAPIDVARKTARLARLLDDADAMEWLRFEISGYGAGTLDEKGVRAATRSNRAAPAATDGSPQWWTAHLAALAAEADAARIDLAAPVGPSSYSQASAWDANIESAKAKRRQHLQQVITAREGLIQTIVGAFHEYASAKYQELRFGAAVETAFEIVRAEVDARISELVPDALPKLSAAFENTTSANAEDWASAAATCRRLLKAAADALRPPGPVKNGRVMDDDHYLNRLVDWIVTTATSQTAADLISADVEHLGTRLNAVLDAGHKGAHAEVSRFDASRFLTGTYLLLGDILRIGTRA